MKAHNNLVKTEGTVLSLVFYLFSHTLCIWLYIYKSLHVIYFQNWKVTHLFIMSIQVLRLFFFLLQAEVILTKFKRRFKLSIEV